MGHSVKRGANGRFTSHLGVISLSASDPTRDDEPVHERNRRRRRRLHPRCGRGLGVDHVTTEMDQSDDEGQPRPSHFLMDSLEMVTEM